MGRLGKLTLCSRCGGQDAPVGQHDQHIRRPAAVGETLQHQRLYLPKGRIHKTPRRTRIIGQKDRQIPGSLQFQPQSIGG